MRHPATRRPQLAHRIAAVTAALSLLAAGPAAAATPASVDVPTAGGGASVNAAGTIVLPPAADAMPASWVQAFAIPYGDGPDELGLGLQGDGEGILVGPNSGAQAPDGSWWFVDTHHFRIARYAANGTFIEDFPLEEEHLVDGVYFPHGSPRVLDDGTFLAGNLAISSATTDLLRIRRGAVDVVRLPGEALLRTDDGRRLYGFEWAQDTIVEADVAAGSMRETEWFRTRRGDRYRVTSLEGRLRVVLPDANPPVDRSWPVVTESGAPMMASVEVASGEDGTLHLLMTGFEDVPETVDRVGYTTISPEGTLGAVEPIISPHESTDPGGQSHLGVQPLGVRPWLVFMREDGVHVYQREPRPTPIVRSIDAACPTASVPASPFTDTPSSGAHGRSIACMAWWDVIRGTSATTFAPASGVTRGQMASLLIRVIAAAGVTVPATPPDRFVDDGGTTHERSIDQLAALGIVDGHGDRYRPAADVTRAQMASMVVRTTEHLLERTLPEPSDHFVDDEGSVHAQAIDKAAAAGIATGVAPERYAPGVAVSRAQTASLLARALDLLVEENVTTPPS